MPDSAERRAWLLRSQDVPEHWNEIAAVVAREVMGAEIRIRVPLSVLDRILIEGYKTQRETLGTKGGKFNPQLRDKIETKMFGPGAAPVYGYLHDTSASLTALNSHHGDAYGEVAIVLKPEVRQRTTVTMGDSLQLRHAPAPLRLSKASQWTGADVFAATPHPEYYPRRDAFHVEYIEAQVHGGITLADIERIEVRPISKQTVEGNPYRNVRKNLSSNNEPILTKLRTKYPGLQIVQTDAWVI